MKNLENIKAILFDADGTIINHKECEKQALKYLFENIGFKYKDEYQEIFRPLDRKLWDDVVFNRTLLKKEDIPEYRFKIFFNKIQLNYSDYKNANTLFQDGLSQSSAIIKNADIMMKYLYKKKFDLYVVTNGLVRLQKPRITNSKISQFIKDIIVSEEVGETKPNPKIFNVLLERYNLKPDNAVMIGDSLEKDIIGAKNAGIKSIWYNPNEKNNNIQIIPDYEIRDLLDLKEILDGSNEV